MIGLVIGPLRMYPTYQMLTGPLSLFRSLLSVFYIQASIYRLYFLFSKEMLMHTMKLYYICVVIMTFTKDQYVSLYRMIALTC